MFICLHSENSSVIIVLSTTRELRDGETDAPTTLVLNMFGGFIILALAVDSTRIVPSQTPIGDTFASVIGVSNPPPAVMKRSGARPLFESSANVGQPHAYPCHGRCKGTGTCCYDADSRTPCCDYVHGVCCSAAQGGGCCAQGYECEGSDDCRRHAHTPHSHSPHNHNPHNHNPHGHAPHAHQPQGATWPTFSTVNELQKSPWAAYFRNVYNGLPTSYPFAISDLWLLHDSALISARVTPIPASSTCPAKPLDRYSLNDDYQPPKVSWIWHAYPYAALAPNTWVEVLHEADPFGDETHGAWMLYTPGSGIYFDIGKTIVFQEHQDAYTHFNTHSNVDMSLAAAKGGYDSVQFLAHVDHVNYPCDSYNTGRAGFTYMGVEIVAVKMVGKYACGSAAGAPSSIKRGWAASSGCSCDNSKQFLNCKGTPELLQTKVTRASRLQTNMTRTPMPQTNMT